MTMGTGMRAMIAGSGLLLAACSGGDGAKPAQTAEVTKGEEIFTRVCSACHVVSNENRVGPGLRAVIGRKVASVSGYEYSDAIKKDRSEIWSAERIQSYLMGPLNMYPEGRMAITPLTPADSKAVVAYLEYRQEGE